MPFFSVVTPVHNAKPFLAKAVESLQRQPFRDWELILVDSASTDGSEEICRHLATVEPRVRLHRVEDNLGPGPARNRGLELAQGRHVLFLDADDAIAEGTLGFLADCAQRHREPDLIYLPAVETLDPFDPTTPGTPCKPPLEPDLAGPMDRFLHAIAHRDRTGFQVWMFMFRRDFLLRNGLAFKGHRMGEDIEFTLRALCLAECFATLDRTFYLWRQSMSRSYIATYAPHGWAFVEATVSMLQFLASTRLDAERQDMIKHYAQHYLEHFERRFVGGLTKTEAESRVPLVEELERLAIATGLPRPPGGLLAQTGDLGAHAGILAFREQAITRDLAPLAGREGRDIYLFPAIKKLSWLAWVFQRNGYPVKGLLDNDPAKIGLVMDGHVIYNPTILRRGYDNPDRLWVVISTSRKSTGRLIAAQLTSYGLREGEHFICWGHDTD